MFLVYGRFVVHANFLDHIPQHQQAALDERYRQPLIMAVAEAYSGELGRNWKNITRGKNYFAKNQFKTIPPLVTGLSAQLTAEGQPQGQQR